ncbi:MAG: Dibenzothiophene desulfurization enzyme C [Paracidovorax wautersii]|uniref:Dibenzothiophene desulfurization enzyme C n=1 Tax=Paracidovorax wautersii TaxID=1177982 RepID=A0A7V8JPI1_9BURK|nr:MAG: Dibenzothiophene desulfurization enzyme C [Paracidovorax wautersii]
MRWPWSGAARPIDDPVIQQTVGEIGATAFAAEAIVLAAADALDRVNQARAREGGEQLALAHAAAVAAAQAKVVVDELVVRVAGQLFDVGGASAATQRYNLDRHWRNARTLASHNPATLKARNLGEHALLGTVLPSGFF